MAEHKRKSAQLVGCRFVEDHYVSVQFSSAGSDIVLVC